ncbi:hypothetical protein AVEN_249254-1 [Araneus ventricosus]|uniref:Uncharacterized protein n=1 Tax=Araneus ventricosus TaxID=182803 RepID=A0A4Y2KE10_ARAVE|nr:hypothetical protein AVEN_249254-1 [Araneus ventricosus]
MRSCRISKKVLAPMVMRLLRPISDDGSYPVAVREQEIEKEAALKAQQIAAKGKKKCAIKNKNLEETDEPPAKRALLSNTSNEELKVPSRSGDIEQLKKNRSKLKYCL